MLKYNSPSSTLVCQLARVDDCSSVELECRISSEKRLAAAKTCR